MKHIIYILLLAFCPLATLQADNLTPIVSVVPCPVQMVPGTGNFLFSGSTVLRGGKRGTGPRGTEFRQPLHPGRRIHPRAENGKGKGDVCFVTDPFAEKRGLQAERQSRTDQHRGV